LDSLKQELEYSRKVAQYDSSYQTKVFIDSVKVFTVQNQLADEIQDSMEPNHGWVWFTVCIGLSATILTIISIAE